MDRFVVQFWERDENNNLELTRCLSRINLRPCIQMMEHYTGIRGIVGVAVYDRGTEMYKKGDCGEYVACVEPFIKAG